MTLATHAVGLQGKAARVLLGLLVLIAGQTQSAVAPAELPARPTGAAAFGRAHEQRLALLAMLALQSGEGGSVKNTQRARAVQILTTYDGVVVAFEANVGLGDAGAIAVFVAAALGGAVVPHEAKVTTAHAGRHARPVHAALRAHRLTLTN